MYIIRGAVLGESVRDQVGAVAQYLTRRFRPRCRCWLSIPVFRFHWTWPKAYLVHWDDCDTVGHVRTSRSVWFITNEACRGLQA